jgi:hypothetical protein
VAWRAGIEEARRVPSSPLRALIETHVEPVLVRAGFAAGQWTVDDASVTFCAAADDYRSRHARLVDDRYPWNDAWCVDIIIDGSLDAGITRFEVEFEPLADVLTRAGQGPDVAVLRSLVRLDQPEDDLQRLGEILSRLYNEALNRQRPPR